MTGLSTHVLDAAAGVAAVGVQVVLSAEDGTEVARAATDADGRARLADGLGPGTYRVAFATGRWAAAAGREVFHPEVVVAVTVEAGRDHLHVPLLLSPFAYTTYRGS